MKNVDHSKLKHKRLLFFGEKVTRAIKPGSAARQLRLLTSLSSFLLLLLCSRSSVSREFRSHDNPLVDADCWPMWPYIPCKVQRDGGVSVRKGNGNVGVS